MKHNLHFKSVNNTPIVPRNLLLIAAKLDSHVHGKFAFVLNAVYMHAYRYMLTGTTTA